MEKVCSNQKIDTTWNFIYPNNHIFNFLNPNNNDCFSKMNTDDLMIILNYINNYYLDFRDELGIDSKDTFGVEIEAEFLETSFYEIERKVAFILNNKWDIKKDATLRYGIEITSPKLIDEKEGWLELKSACHILEGKTTIDKNSGGHIHVGAHILSDKLDNWMNFIKLYGAYENVISRFLYGEFLNPRSSLWEFAYPVGKTFLNKYSFFKTNKIDDVIYLISSFTLTKNQGINFKNIKDFNNIEEMNTIEFRTPNGSLNPIVWQNNINLIIKLLNYAKSPRFNHDIIDARISKNSEIDINFIEYQNIFLDQALELCDLIFDNNLDKIYFLRQYLKSYDMTPCTSELIKAKEFTK